MGLAAFLKKRVLNSRGASKLQMGLAAFPKETCAQQSRSLKTSNGTSGFFFQETASSTVAGI